MIQINLVPDIKREFLRTKRIKRSIIVISLAIAAASVGIVVLLALTTYGLQRRHISNLETDIQRNTDELKSINDLDKILTVQGQLGALPELHNQTNVSSRLFTFINKITPSKVSLSNIEVLFTEDAGALQIEIDGVSDSFKTVNQFIDTIKNTKYKVSGSEDEINAFTNVTLNFINTDDTSFKVQDTSFNLTFEYDPEIFSSMHDNVTFTVPNIASSVSQTEKPNVFTEGTE